MDRFCGGKVSTTYLLVLLTLGFLHYKLVSKRMMILYSLTAILSILSHTIWRRWCGQSFVIVTIVKKLMPGKGWLLLLVPLTFSRGLHDRKISIRSRCLAQARDRTLREGGLIGMDTSTRSIGVAAHHCIFNGAWRPWMRLRGILLGCKI